MSKIRNVEVKSRSIYKLKPTPESFWQADLIAGLLNDGFAKTPLRAAALRILAQDFAGSALDITKPKKHKLTNYFQPRLFQAAIRPRIDEDGGSGSLQLRIASHTFVISALSGIYSETTVTPEIALTRKETTDIQLPPLVLDSGAVDIGVLRSNPSDLREWLQLGMDGNKNKWKPSDLSVGIFGKESALTVLVDTNTTVRAVRMRLVPDGIEFDATVSDPFDDKSTLLSLTLLFTYETSGDSGTFILKPVGGKDMATLRGSFDRLLTALGRFPGSPITVDVAPGPCPIFWTIDESNGMLTTKPASIHIDPRALQVTLTSERADSAILPSVSRITVGGANITRNALTITSPAATLTRAAKVVVQWSSSLPAILDFSLASHANGAKPIPMIAESEALGAQLRDQYSASHVLPEDSKSPLYAFFPLERGFLQLPTPIRDESAALAVQPPATALTGLVRIRAEMIEPSEPDIQIVGAETASITLSSPALGTLKVVAELNGAIGTLSGTLFAAASSPSPVNILPRLDRGAIAAMPIDLVFGDANTLGWTIEHGAFNTAKLRTMSAEIAISITGPEFPDDPKYPHRSPKVIAWLAHPSMALLAAMPATRTQASPATPLETRDLVPHEHVLRAASLTLRTTFGLGASAVSMFPTLSGLAATTASLDWPWPTADDNANMEASAGLTAISLVSLTLPGVEFRPGDPEKFSFSDLRGSVRFDLPILTELFASANLPKPPTGKVETASDPTPTALEPLRLNERWMKNAGRVTLTRTINDRVTDWQTLGVTLKKVAIKGLVEPFVWKPDVLIDKMAGTLPLGAYTLGAERASGSVALAGLHKHFSIDKGELVALPDEKGSTISVIGWAATLRDDANYQIDSRGAGHFLKPDRTSSGDFIEWRALRFEKTWNAAESWIAASAAVLPFEYDGVKHGLRFRDLPINAGSLSFTADSGIEMIARPDGTMFGRETLTKATYEWSIFRFDTDNAPGSFVLRLGPFIVRPQRLVELTLKGNHVEAALSNFTIIGNIEPPSTPLTEGATAPFIDDEPYASGNPIALEFLVDNGKAKLTAVKSVTIMGNDVTVGASPARVTFALDALPLYGQETPLKRPLLPVSLGLKLEAAGGMLAAAANSGTINVKLFGNRVELQSGNVTLQSNTLAATFENHPAVNSRSGLSIDRIVAGWENIAEPTAPTLRMNGSLYVSAGFPEPNPELPQCALIAWTLGSSVRWFGTHATVQAEIDHREGSITVEANQKLSASDQFLIGWPLPNAQISFALACAVARKPGVQSWPVADLAAGFAEVRCKGGSAHAPLDIRHRLACDGQPLHWRSNLLVTSQPLDIKSAIAWPVESLDDTKLPSKAFAARPDHPLDWVTDITIAHDTATFAHTAKIGMIDVPLDAALLEQSGDTIGLQHAWSFSALVSHRLERDPDTFAWTAIDEIVVADSRWLVNRCDEALNPNKNSGHAFAPRYQENIALVGGNKLFAPSAGVLASALARAGIPTYEMAKAVAKGGKDREPAGLMIAGASLIDVETEVANDFEPSRGVTLAMPWLAPFQADANLGVLATIPQRPPAAPLTLSVSAYDLTGAYPRRLDIGSVVPFAAGNGSVRTLTGMRNGLIGEPITAFTPVSQAIIIGPEDAKPKDEPATPEEWLARPIWLRTLAAWRYILKKPDAMRGFSDRVKTVLIANSPKVYDGKSRVVRLALTHRENAIASNASRVLDVATTRADLVVLATDRVSVIALSGADSAALMPNNSADGGVRNRLARLAFAVTPDPLAILTGHIVDDAENPNDRTHAPLAFLVRPAILRELEEPRALRKASRTLFASPALAWPRASERLSTGASAALALGKQRIIQDSDHSWAGEDRSFSVPARAFELDQNFNMSSVLAMGQRTLFRRSKEELLAPIDRALIPIPPRPRLPLPISTEQALNPLRLDHPEGGKEPAIAATQPAPFEVVTTGRRPGTLAFHHEGLVFAKSAAAFDSVATRFGRPGDRGPVVWRQTRAPRSTVFQDIADLDRRRGTFLAQDIVDDATLGENASLAHAFIASGPLCVLRYTPILTDNTKAVIRCLLIVPEAKFLGVGALPENIKLLVEARKDPLSQDGAAPDPLAVLARHGFLGGGELGLRATLTVGTQRFAFSGLAWCEQASFESRKTMLAFSLGGLRQAAANALRNATADTMVAMLLDPGEPSATTPPSPGFVALSVDARTGLLAGPSRILSLPLPIAPAQRAYLPIRPATVAFGDPSYDRALASKTVSSRGPDSILLAIDRIEYNPTSTLHVAVGKVNAGRSDSMDKDVTWDALQEPSDFKLQFNLIRKSTPNMPAIPLRVHSVLPEEGFKYSVNGGRAYAIAIADLRAASEDPVLEFEPGDRIVVTSYWGVYSISVTATIVAEPVIAPPPSVFGLVTRDTASGAERLTSALFASAPLPQGIEYPDLTADLASGMVRRRGLFNWLFVPRVTLVRGEKAAALVKIDRTGGGQLPDSIDDFLEPSFES